ncbi:hypothetical protein [Brevundimonas lenta]|uniref:Uncharacterized protein n=1 Tax=Brevundimonas lenta TaxID=424796 RepID=A0A7W6JE46_9CAUL|nr:hypothetical protein [Brevundimonas lenta]MBB4083421.1 hypothetical protein [Brevundimonas lenta]
MAAALAALTLASCAVPTEGVTQRRQEITPRPEGQRWTELLRGIGQPELRLGDRVYRKTTEGPGGGSGYFEVIEHADGTGWTRYSGDARPVQLHRGDLDVFHSLFDAHAFLTMPYEDPGRFTCLDECFEVYFEMESDEGYRQIHLRPSDQAVEDAAWELQQISGARRRAGLFQPRPWWQPSRTRPAGRPWIEDRSFAELGFAPSYEDRFYRLIRFRGDAAPEAIEIGLTRGPYDDCGTYRTRDGQIRQIVFCDINAPNQIEITARGRTVTQRASGDPLEEILGRSEFPAMSTEDAACTVPPPGRTPWVLEAVVNGRYRYVCSNGCNDRGLNQVLAGIDRLADEVR